MSRTDQRRTARRRKDAPATKRAPAPAALDGSEPSTPGLEGSERDSYSSTAFAELLDRSTHAGIANATLGLSPAALAGAYLDWLVHLGTSPGRRMQLAEKAFRKWLRFMLHLQRCAAKRDEVEPCIEPLPQDRRFRDPEWRRMPFSAYYQSFLLVQQWWHNATTGLPGVTRQHERMVEFGSRQILDVFSPSNFIAANPTLLRKTQAEGGMNLARGFQNWLEDLERLHGGRPKAGTENFRPGREVATTPGKVVYRNRLIELIQYAPTTEEVRPEPILVTPAWIMKYYILDLSERNSLVRFLCAQGYTVFMISWLNPGPEDRDLSFADYRELGVEAAIDAVQAIRPGAQIHGVGYCIGGTLLAIAAAAATRRESPFRSLTFLAAQIDFTEAGELQLFVNESQLAFLDDMMWEQGFLDTQQMSGAFHLLRSNDLIWSRLVNEYLMGERPEMIDLMAWNADATRMPFRMHSEYLRSLYLNNDLTEGRFKVEGRPISVTDIDAPVFAVATQSDHVAPWRSVYKLHLYLDTDITFLLTTGGHNAGIVSEPGHPRRSYQVAATADGDAYVDPDAWAESAPRRDGSWWPEWTQWLDARSGQPTAPPPIGAPEKGYSPLADAPGTYVMRP